MSELSLLFGNSLEKNVASVVRADAQREHVSIDASGGGLELDDWKVSLTGVKLDHKFKSHAWLVADRDARRGTR